MSVEGWRLYNHAAIPSTPPHINPDISLIESGNIWKAGWRDTPLLARWTTGFDCDYVTNWWYVIKDSPIDISTIKSKRRYRINKGTNNFDVYKINPKEYKEDLYKITIKAYETYPSKYKPSINYDSFIASIESWKYAVYGAFFRETESLCGYALLKEGNKCTYLSVVKVLPFYEKLEINAAIVYQILQDNQDFILNGGYICDGSRNISHETAYQDYLERLFGFRKAYCQLHIEYNPKVKWIIKLIYPFRNFLFMFDNNKLIHKVNSVLKMEELARDNK